MTPVPDKAAVGAPPGGAAPTLGRDDASSPSLPTTRIRVRTPAGDLAAPVSASPADTVSDIRDHIFAAWPTSAHGGGSPYTRALAASVPATPDDLRLISSGRLLSDPGAPFLAAAVPKALMGLGTGAFPSALTLHVVARRPEDGGGGGGSGRGGKAKKGGEVGVAGGCCGGCVLS